MLSGLALLKRRALRKGVWFRVLSPIERSIYDLTMRAVRTIKSGKLLKAIKVIMDKLREALESPVSILSRTVGRQLAIKIACVAYSWGHSEARGWASDEHFARYLAIYYMNTPEYYRVELVRAAIGTDKENGASVSQGEGESNVLPRSG